MSYKRSASNLWLESGAKESGTPVLMSRLSVQCMAHSILKCVKPIFHCDAKPFALGIFVSPRANIPTCWYLLCWVRHIFFASPIAKPQTKIS